MLFARLLEIASSEPVFETGLLLAGAVDPADVRRQLSRWVRSGRIQQLRRGLYALAAPYRKTTPHPFLIANHLVQPSYVSLQAALAHHGLIPEAVVVTTSVTTARPGTRQTVLGSFTYRHLARDWLLGFREVEISPGQRALIATPEKALLDLVRLTPSADRPAFLQELRLQNLEVLDLGELKRLAGLSRKPKLLRAAKRISAMAAVEAEEFERS